MFHPPKVLRVLLLLLCWATLAYAQDVPLSTTVPLFMPQQFGAVPNDGLSDKAAFDAAFDALKAAGGGVLYIPAGTYIWDGDPIGPVSAPSYSDVFTREASNITIIGAGRDATIIQYTNNGGSGIRLGLPRVDANRLCTAPLLPIKASTCVMPSFGLPDYKQFNAAIAGQTTVTMKTTSDVAAFTVGDDVFLEDDRMTDLGSSPAYFEYNTVTAINAATGVVTLAVPLTSNYALTDANYPPAIGVVKTVPHDILVRDLTFQNTTGQNGGVVLATYGTKRATLDNVHFLNGVVYTAFSEDTTIQNSFIEIKPGVNTGPTELIDGVKRLHFRNNIVMGGISFPLIVLSEGGQIIGNTVIGTNGSGAIEIEGANSASLAGTVPVHMLVSNNIIYQSGSNPAIYILYSVDAEVSNNQIVLQSDPATSGAVGIFIDGPMSRVIARGNIITELGSTVGDGIQIRSQGAAFPVSNVVVNSNFIKVPGFGVKVVLNGVGPTIDKLNVTNNTIIGAGTAVYTVGATNVTLDANLTSATLSLAAVTAPGALTAALGAGAGNLTNGAYSYRVTYTNANGETEGGTISSPSVTVVDATVNGKISLTAIPTGPVGILSRKIYRTIANGATYKLQSTIADNTTTTATDNIADASLGATVPTLNTTSVLSAGATGITTLVPWFNVNGTNLLPAYSWTNANDSGFSFAGTPAVSATIDASIDGATVTRWIKNNFIVGPLSLTFGANFTDNDTRVSWAGVGELKINPVLFANLGAPVNGSFCYCSDCTIANPCAGVGNGAFAKRLNGVWVCN